MNHAVAKALFKGAPFTFDVLGRIGIFEATIREVSRNSSGPDLLQLIPTSHFLSCFEDPRVVEGSFVRAIDRDDTIEINLYRVEPEAGQVALAAYYDGWNYTVKLVVFRDGAKGLEGYNHSSALWIPARRFRVLGVLSGFGITTDSGNSLIIRRAEGVNFTKYKNERDQMRRYAFATRIYQRDEDLGAAPLDLIAAALGSKYVPDEPRPEGAFVTGLSAQHVPRADEVTKRYTRLYFQEEATIQPRAGLLALVAFQDDDRDGWLDVAALYEGEGGLWAETADDDHPRPPGEWRFVRACVGGENPEGLLL